MERSLGRVGSALLISHILILVLLQVQERNRVVFMLNQSLRFEEPISCHRATSRFYEFHD